MTIDLATGSRLYVGGIRHGTTEAVLGAWLTAHGVVVHAVHLVCDRATGQPRGFAFVEFDQDGGAQEALDALAGSSVDDRMPTMQIVTSLSERARARERDRATKERRDP